MAELTQGARGVLDGLVQRRPDLESCVPALEALHARLVQLYDSGGTLFTCGNGGSHADAQHIVGELCKSFERARPLPQSVKDRLLPLPYGAELAEHLEQGLRAVTLGCNGPLKTAVENDSPLRDVAFAQEAMALMRPGDVLLALSTSGNASNCMMAMSAANAAEGDTVAFTGPGGGRMAEVADLVVKAPGDSTKTVQEAHIALWHTMCLMIEAHYFEAFRS